MKTKKLNPHSKIKVIQAFRSNSISAKDFKLNFKKSRVRPLTCTFENEQDFLSRKKNENIDKSSKNFDELRKTEKNTDVFFDFFRTSKKHIHHVTAV